MGKAIKRDFRASGKHYFERGALKKALQKQGKRVLKDSFGKGQAPVSR